MQRCVLTGENGKNKELKEIAKIGWEIRKVEVIYSPTLSHTEYFQVTVL